MLHVVADDQCNVTFSQSIVQLLNQNVNDVQQMHFFQGMEDHVFVDSIQKFRAEVAFQFLHDVGLHSRVAVVLFRFLESQGHALLNKLGAQIRRHHKQGVFEIHFPAQTVRQDPFIQNL